MKFRIIFLTNLIVFSLIFVPILVSADNAPSHEDEIEEGKSLVENKVNCNELTDEQLEAVGDYLMEQVHPGESHEAMHKMMNMEEGTKYHKNFHINLAKTMYCGESGTLGMMPMMNVMKTMGGDDNSTMGNIMGWSNWGMSGGWSWLGWILMILFWVLITVGIIFLIKCLIWGCPPRGETKKPALEILKERYAEGEISKEEFEERKKDLI